MASSEESGLSTRTYHFSFSVAKSCVLEISEIYNVSPPRIYILENTEDKRNLMCTYNIEFKDEQEVLRNTISIHRKKQTNTLYTINALNGVVSLMNEGRPDPSFEVDWEMLRNMLLVTDEENNLKKILTKIYDIVHLD